MGEDTKASAAEASTLPAGVSAARARGVRQEMADEPVVGGGTGRTWRRCIVGPRWTWMDGWGGDAVEELATDTGAGMAE